MADDETPPENPFESGAENGGPPIIDANENALPQGAPEVAAKAGKTFVILGVVGAVVLFLLYSILGGKKEVVEQTEPTVIEVAPKPPEIPSLPVEEPQVNTPPPDIAIPPIPPPVEIPQTMQNINPLTPKDDGAAQAQAKARLQRPIMVKDGGSGALGGILPGGPTTPEPAGPQDANSLFARAAASSKASRVQATHIGDLRRTIAQGRIIQATLETAINTDLSAPIRAVVSVDTYGEAGTVPLIPKGSRLIGRYNNVVTSGQTRVFAIWTRIIRPDGVDIELGSPESALIDAIGQAGVAGQLDTKFQEIFARSLVSSAMNIAMAIGSDKISGGGTTTTTNSTQGGSQTSGDSVTTATTNALNRLGSTTDGFLQKFLSVPPTILVDQGTKVNVFVNKDIVFPNDLAGAQVIP